MSILKLQKEDQLVRLLEFRFQGSKNKHKPDSVPTRGREPVDKLAKRTARKDSPSGVRVLESVQCVGLADMLDELEAAGYRLVDAFHEALRNPSTGWSKHVVRFIFAHEDHATPGKEFLARRDEMREAFREITETAAWAVEIWKNPFFSDGEVVPGFNHVSINGAARDLLIQPDGSPVVKWERDEDGEKVGDAPLPRTPDWKLGLSEEGEVAISPYEES